jgi:hypothetical protein
MKEKSRFPTTANTFLENVAKFNYLRTTIRDQNYIDEDIFGRLNSGNAFYHFNQYLPSECYVKTQILKKRENHACTSPV